MHGRGGMATGANVLHKITTQWFTFEWPAGQRQTVNTSSMDKKQSQSKIRLLLGTISLKDEGGP